MSNPSVSSRPTVSERFQLLDVAGSGGMATVYRALDQRTGETVALKLLHATSEGVNSQRFVREVEVLKSLVHPRVVRYVDHGTTPEGHPYLAMEWLEGEDLSKRLGRQGLTPRESLALAGHVAEALAAAHRRGVVHRDIKPSNLFLRRGEADGVVVLDFGIARRTLERSMNIHTQTGDVLGTPHYMAPEQARGARDLSPAADVFALGCVLFQCLTGRPPFVADHLVGVLAKILVEEAPGLRSLRPEMPEELDQLLARFPDLAVADPDNAAPKAVRATGRLCYPSANRAVTALEHDC